MTRSVAPAAAPATDTQSIKRSRQDDLDLPNRARRIRALCYALDDPILPTDPASRSPLLTIDGVAEQSS
jgi:hypothetical protein